MAPSNPGAREFDSAHPEQVLKALIARIASRDHAALAEFYDRTAPYSFGLIQRIVGDPSAAEEVTLDLYMQVWKHSASYDERRGAPLAWLMILARSRALDWRRTRAGRGKGREERLPVTAEFTDRSPNPEESAAIAGRRRVIQAALAVLSPDQREAIELAFYDGLSHSEIATHLNAPLGTVKTRIRLGMQHLRHQLKGYAGTI